MSNYIDIVDSLRYIRTIYYHNNLGLDAIKQLYEKNLIVCGTEKFWKQHGRKIVSDVEEKTARIIEEVAIPVYKYRYISNNSNKPVTYAEINSADLKQAVKVGMVRRETYIAGYKKIQLINISNTVGKEFSLAEYEVDFIQLMKIYGVYDADSLLRELFKEANISQDIRIDIEEVMASLMEKTDYISINANRLNYISEQLIDIFNNIDKKIKRKKLIDIKKEKYDEIADDIICAYEAKSIRNILGGA